MFKADTRIFVKSIYNVWKGRYIWKKVLKRYFVDLKFDFVILLPKGDSQVNYYTLLYLNKFIEYLEKRKNSLASIGIPVIRRNENFFIITNDSDVNTCAQTICRRVSQIITFSDDEIEQLLQYYCLYPFTNRLIIGLLDGIPGRNDYTALIKCGFTVEELVANCIFDLKIPHFNYKSRPKIPLYNGHDSTIVRFINSNDTRIKSE